MDARFVSVVMWLICFGLLFPRPTYDSFALTFMVIGGLVCLAIKRDFPHRESAFAYSWIGPFVTLAYNWTLHGQELLFLKMLLSGNWGGYIALVSINIFAMLVGMLWLWRWYGLIPFFAAASCICENFSSRFVELARNYPYRRLWWLIPVAISCFYGCCWFVIVSLSMSLLR